MACGKDLIKSLQKIGCPLENVSADDLDWYFDDPKIASFIFELCSRIDSGHLSSTNNVNIGETSKTEISVESIVTSESREYFDYEMKTKQLELNLAHKKNYKQLLEMKLQLLKNQKAKEDMLVGLLEIIASRNSAEALSLEAKIRQRIKQLTNLLKTLIKSNDKLLAALADPELLEGSAKPVIPRKYPDSFLHNFSETGACKNYLEKEKGLCDSLAHCATARLQETLNARAGVPVEEWWKEQGRMEKCFIMTIKEYNFLVATESSLNQEISYLKKCMEQGYSIQNLTDIPQLRETNRRLLLSLTDIMDKNVEVYKELALKAISSLLVASGKIKLERLERFKSNEEKLLQSLREVQYRLSFFQFAHKLESQRNKDVLTISQDICALLRRFQNAPAHWIIALKSVKESQERSVAVVVPANDHIMETVAKVLGSDQEELCCTFNSIVKSAEMLDHNLLLQRNVNSKKREEICNQLEKLQIIAEVLNLIQVPLNKNTQYHGDYNLCQAKLRLEQNMKLYLTSVSGYKKQLAEHKNMLQNCPREVFIQNQRLKAIQEKAGQF